MPVRCPNGVSYHPITWMHTVRGHQTTPHFQASHPPLVGASFRCAYQINGPHSLKTHGFYIWQKNENPGVNNQGYHAPLFALSAGYVRIYLLHPTLVPSAPRGCASVWIYRLRWVPASRTYQLESPC